MRNRPPPRERRKTVQDLTEKLDRMAASQKEMQRRLEQLERQREDARHES